MAARIREIRQAKGLTQWELAKRANIHPVNLAKIERGDFRLYAGWRRRIAEALGVPEEALENTEQQQSVGN